MAENSIGDLPRTRKEAKTAKSKHYFTGKQCSRGHVEKRITSTGHCLKCAAGYSSQDRIRNPEYHRAATRRWEDENPEKKIASTLSWRKANSQKYYDGARKRVAAWAKANPEKVRNNGRIRQRRRRARKLEVGGSHTSDDVAAIRKAQKDRCGYCRAKLNSKGHVDHIVALSKGGSNARSNLQLLCGSCNRSKSARDPIAFAQSLGKLL